MLWNAGQFRRQSYDLNDLITLMAKLANLGDVNITFKPALPPCKGTSAAVSIAADVDR